MALDRNRTRTRMGASLAAAVLSLAANAVAGADDATAVLERARQAYATSVPFREILDLELRLPDGTIGTRRQEYGVGRSGAAFLRLSAEGSPGLHVVASEGRVLALWAHIPDRYAETVFEGGLQAALTALEGAQVQLAAPAAVVAAQGGGSAAFLDALRFGILGPLEPLAAREVASGAGRRLVEVELAAANGSAVLGLDPASWRLATLRITLGEGDSQVRAEGGFTFRGEDPGAELDWPDVEGRISVATIPALEASDYPLGEPAAAITVPALDGGPVDLGALGGRVVVLDFWATWCVPCWTGLRHTAELTAWAAASGLPVEVFAVDSLERTESLEAQRRLARDFLAAKGLALEVLVDYGNEAFAAFHNPGLPSLVIVDRDGRLAEYHSGLVEDMVSTVRTRVLELLAAGD